MKDQASTFNGIILLTETRPGSSESQKSDEKDPSKSPDLGPLTDFHQLLLLRMLRPDRLPVGLSKYINKYLTLNLPEQIEFSLSDVLIDSKRHLGVLLLLPENLSQMKSHPVTRLRLTTPPVDVLFSLAKVTVLRLFVEEVLSFVANEAGDVGNNRHLPFLHFVIPFMANNKY